MKQSIFIIAASFLTALSFAQNQSQQLFAQNNINPPAQSVLTNNAGNLGNFNVNDDNNTGNVQELQINSFDNSNDPVQSNELDNQSVSTNNVKPQSNKSSGFEIAFGGRSMTSSSSSASASSSKTNRRTFTKKVSKFKRNFYGKLASHKKSRYLVDICFNWG